MAIRTIRAFPLRTAGLTQDQYSQSVEDSLTDLTGAVDDFNAAATLAQLTTTTTSSSSVLIGTGAKTFTVPSGLGFVVGMTLRIANSSTAYMTGDVTSYSSTTLVVNVTSVVGSGTLASWSISLSAVGASTAATVSNVPAGNIAATTVQAAINELDTEKLSSAAGAVTDTNLNSIITAGTIGDNASIPVVTYTAKGRISSVSSALKITQSTVQNSTSGTSIDFTGIPTWAKRVSIVLAGVSTSGTSTVIIQLGSTTFTTTGYTGASDNQASGGGTATAFTSGLGLERTAAAAYVRQGIATFINITGNRWVGTYIGSSTGTVTVEFGSTEITLAGVLDRVRITTSGGTDTFDAGQINVVFE